MNKAFLTITISTIRRIHILTEILNISSTILTSHNLIPKSRTTLLRNLLSNLRLPKSHILIILSIRISHLIIINNSGFTLTRSRNISKTTNNTTITTHTLTSKKISLSLSRRNSLINTTISSILNSSIRQRQFSRLTLPLTTNIIIIIFKELVKRRSINTRNSRIILTIRSLTIRHKTSTNHLFALFSSLLKSLALSVIPSTSTRQTILKQHSIYISKLQTSKRILPNRKRSRTNIITTSITTTRKRRRNLNRTNHIWRSITSRTRTTSI